MKNVKHFLNNSTLSNMNVFIKIRITIKITAIHIDFSLIIKNITYYSTQFILLDYLKYNSLVLYH